MVELVEYLVGKLATEGSWSVELLENGEESDIVVRVSGKDIGKVIGKQGKSQRPSAPSSRRLPQSPRRAIMSS